MKTRIITALVAIAGIFPFFWFSEPVGNGEFLHYVFPFLFSAITLISVWELLHCVDLEKNYYISIPLYVAALGFPMLARVMYEDVAGFVRFALLFAMALAVYFFAVIVFHFGKVDMGRISLAFVTSFYIIAANSSVILLRDVPRVGRFLFLIPFIFAWVTDTFAYFTGRLFGKHKLIPNVSPKKTVEGAIGGFVFCAATAILYGLIVSAAFDVTPNYAVLAVGGILIGVVSQIGDLIMSAVKRQYGVKDFGFILPGHGGLLDRFDSSMAVTVVVATIANYFVIFS